MNRKERRTKVRQRVRNKSIHTSHSKGKKRNWIESLKQGLIKSYLSDFMKNGKGLGILRKFFK